MVMVRRERKCLSASKHSEGCLYKDWQFTICKLEGLLVIKDHLLDCHNTGKRFLRGQVTDLRPGMRSQEVSPEAA